MVKLENIVKNFEGQKITVVGDIMLDKFLKGDVFRINPEAPVPIVSLNNEFNELGGAGNVAANIASLGGEVSLFGFIGVDAEAEIVKSLLSKQNIAAFLDQNKLTTVKTRVIGGNQQLIRFDKEEVCEKQFTEKTQKILISKAKTSSIILISDYAKGAITKELMTLLEPYKERIVVDPKPINKELYYGVFLISPNEKEAKEMASCSDVLEAGKILQDELKTNVLITRGKDGMSVFADKCINIPTYAKEVYDVTGAGDSVIASLSLAIAAGASLEEAAIISNHTAGIAVEKIGTYAVPLSELKARLFFTNKKLVDLNKLKEVVSKAKSQGKKVVWTNGCFDLLHIGHVHYLKEAKKLGDFLIVGINSDDSVKKLKGENRPLQTETERAEIISSLEYADNIIIFPELTVEKYLEELKPDIYVKGEDYNLWSVNQQEKKAIESNNGKIIFIPQIDGKSSSNLIKKASQNARTDSNIAKDINNQPNCMSFPR